MKSLRAVYCCRTVRRAEHSLCTRSHACLTSRRHRRLAWPCGQSGATLSLPIHRMSFSNNTSAIFPTRTACSGAPCADVQDTYGRPIRRRTYSTLRTQRADFPILGVYKICGKGFAYEGRIIFFCPPFLSQIWTPGDSVSGQFDAHSSEVCH